jgi:hypothetical protein
MANLTRCANGHFYDADKNRSCPYCNQTSAGGATTPLTPPIDQIKHAAHVAEDTGETVGFYDEMAVKPVVGWLVSIKGSTAGKDFRLCSGRNYIGREEDMDIVLEGDNKVSRNKHAIVLFDPITQKTLCQAGESRELFYLNSNVVTGTIELKQGDVITIGDTKLMFVPFCGNLHTWN